MAKCQICGKGPVTGNNVSHSHKKTRRRWEPNVQRMKVIYKGQKRRMWVCTSCLKSGRVEKAI